MRGRSGIWGVGAACLALVGCQEYDPSDTERVLAESEALLAELEEQYPSEKLDQKWDYRSTVDPMTDGVTRVACLDSRNAVMLAPPYEPTRVRLCLRDHPQHGRDVYVRLVKGGQYLYRSYEDGTVNVRFDSGPVQTFSAVGASDGSPEVFFIRNWSRFEAAMKDADTTIIQAEIYRHGSPPVTFDTKGFAWPEASIPVAN